MAEESLQTSTARAIRGMDGGGRFITFSAENDMFGGGTDRNYTSGARLTYFDLGAEVPGFLHAFDRLVPTFSINETTSIYYSIGQNLYTPKDITQAAQPPNDRPWAAFLYAAAGLSSITNNHTDNLEVTAGVIGPPAMGKAVQRFIHRHISDSPAPQGWDNQLKAEPALMVSWERNWPARHELEKYGWTAAAVPHVGATVGNVYTYANAGFSLRLSPYAGRWQDDPIRVRPAMPGTGAFVLPRGAFSWYLFGGAEGRAVARNIFLDGNTFRDSHSVDKKPFVADMNAGVAFTYGQARLSYTLVYRTREFEGQDDGDVFGSVGLGFRF